MGRTKSGPSILAKDFEEKAASRHSHISQTRRLNGDAIRDLQTCAELSRGQATAMIYPKAGSRCRGLAKTL